MMIPLEVAADEPPSQDERVKKLIAAFGTHRPFTLTEASLVLGESVIDLQLAFFGEEVSDAFHRVAAHSGKWWCIPADPMTHGSWSMWRKFRHLWNDQQFLSATQFAVLAKIPQPSANFILSAMTTHGYLTCHMQSRNEQLGALYVPRSRRKVVINGRVRRFIHIGY